MEDRAMDARFEALAAETSWLRRLALSVVHDAALAEDIVQETWMVAAERLPEDGRPLRPWLARVIRNLARMSLRSASRRAARESRSDAQPAPAATPEELTERLEIQRRLTEKVLALGEPHRAMVLLHYVESLSSVEIGQRLGVPEGTVRWRLKQALDHIRAELDAEEKGRRAAWCAPLSRFARVPVPRPKAPATRILKPGTTGLALAGVATVAAVAILCVISRPGAGAKARAVRDVGPERPGLSLPPARRITGRATSGRKSSAGSTEAQGLSPPPPPQIAAWVTSDGKSVAGATVALDAVTAGPSAPVAKAVPAPKVCKAGALIFGDPGYVRKPSEAPNPAGQTVRQTPPLSWEGLVFEGDKVFTSSPREIWGGPVAGAITRLAGDEQSLAAFHDGPCADARFGAIWGIAFMRDGTMVVADTKANAILAISDPEKPSCEVTTLVGPKTPLADARLAPSGDTDGPAASAAIGRPAWPVVDRKGNIYFIDVATSKVKMIAPDAAHTVSAVGQLKSGNAVEPYHGMTMLDEKLYAVTSTFSNGVVQEIDPATKKVRVVIDAGANRFPPLEANHSPALGSIANDGNSLLVFGRGYIWRMTTDGSVKVVAGSGWDNEFPKDYNPAGVYPTNALKLFYRFDMGASGASTYLAWYKDAIYWRGAMTSPYVVKITCP
jgi:RNA polymerase sigma-70 factor (ECF subfamily)